MTVDLAQHLVSLRDSSRARRASRTPAFRPARGDGRGRLRPGARERAQAYGLDLSLIDGNLRRTADERLRLLDQNATFVAALKRGRTS